MKEKPKEITHSFERPVEGGFEGIHYTIPNPENIHPKQEAKTAEEVKHINWPIEMFDYINPALHLLHNNKPVLPGSKEHELLNDLWRKCD